MRLDSSQFSSKDRKGKGNTGCHINPKVETEKEAIHSFDINLGVRHPLHQENISVRNRTTENQNQYRKIKKKNRIPDHDTEICSFRTANFPHNTFELSLWTEMSSDILKPKEHQQSITKNDVTQWRLYKG